jgi:hypothetical protein
LSGAAGPVTTALSCAAGLEAFVCMNVPLLLQAFR